jgi:transcriptional regulator with XRE-family HTH domain
LLRRAGHSQADLARLADVDQSSISRYLRGDCEPNLRQLRAIARALGVPATALVTDGAPEVHAVPEGDGYLLFRGERLVGRWHERSIVPVLHVTELDADHAEARRLRKLANGGRRRGN